MKTHYLFSTLLLCTVALPAHSQDLDDYYTESPKSTKVEFIKTANDTVVYKILKKDRSLNTNEVAVPHFAIHTRDNKFVMTIGGQINPIIGYDLGNDLYKLGDAGINFIPAQIPVPRQSGKKSDFFINPLNACIDLQIVGFGGTSNQITGYVKFATDGNSKSLYLDKAYVKWHGFSAGLMNTMFEDESVVPPTIDPQGPNGLVASSGYQIGYVSPSMKGLKLGICIEMPSFYSSTGRYFGSDFKNYGGRNILGEKIIDPTYYNQLVPDVPMFIEWQKSEFNRIRLSGIVRTFNYRDLIANNGEGKHRTTVGWGLQLSGNINPVEPLIFYLQAVYGKGIGAYIQDLQGQPLSFLPEDSAPGKLTPSPMMGWTAGMTYNFNDKWQMNLMASQARVWKAGSYAVQEAGEDNIYDYKYGYYGAANVFYNISSYFQVGLEYLYGYRKTWNVGGASDNRIQMQFMFAL